MPAPTTPPFLLIHVRFPQLSTHRPVRVTQHGLPFYKVPSTPEHTPLMGILYFGWLFRKESLRVGLVFLLRIVSRPQPYRRTLGIGCSRLVAIHRTLEATIRPYSTSRPHRFLLPISPNALRDQAAGYVFITPEGKYSSYRSRKGRRPHRPHRNSRIKNSHLVLSRTPPPRGVPGTHRVNEGRTPTQGGANVVTRGTSRRTRRRAYRAWRRYHNHGLDQGADSPEPPRLESTKATPKRSKWFQQTLHWQEGATRRKKPFFERGAQDHTATKLQQ